eukprot:366257-Chlamydomonas_euryale.AAC.5
MLRAALQSGGIKGGGACERQMFRGRTLRTDAKAKKQWQERIGESANTECWRKDETLCAGRAEVLRGTPTGWPCKWEPPCP